jgi:hypothetical protein
MLIHTHTGCPWDASILPQKAAFGGNVELLQWLKELHVGSWEPDDLAFMLSTAGEEGRLDAAKWLRSIGAPWPKTLWRTLEFTDDPVWHCFWRLDLLQVNRQTILYYITLCYSIRSTSLWYAVYCCQSSCVLLKVKYDVICCSVHASCYAHCAPQTASVRSLVSHQFYRIRVLLSFCTVLLSVVLMPLLPVLYHYINTTV